MELLMRILASKKAIYAMVPVVANFLVLALGYDPTAVAMLVLDAAFAFLVAAQTVLDAVHGSASDGTDDPAARAARTKAAK